VPDDVVEQLGGRLDLRGSDEWKVGNSHGGIIAAAPRVAVVPLAR
jgi:hypothetical protein